MRKGLLLRELHVLPSNFLKSTLFFILVAKSIVSCIIHFERGSSSDTTPKNFFHQLVLTFAAM